MTRTFPISLWFLVVTAGLFCLQWFPLTGVFLMLVGAPLWSIALVNLAMIGVAFEALTAFVPRWWILLPLAFYGGYTTIAVLDHMALDRLSRTYETANASVAAGFDPTVHALVLDHVDGAHWLLDHYALPVLYQTSGSKTDPLISMRLIEEPVCRSVDKSQTLASVSVYVSWGVGKGFCTLSMPGRPTLPEMRISVKTAPRFEGFLPVTRAVTTIALPDGRRLELLGGTAAPLAWLPMPIIGCALNSGAGRWDCTALFSRNTFTPIVPYASRYHSDIAALAAALGLVEVAPENRRGADPEPVRRQMTELEQSTLIRQLAALDAMIANAASPPEEGIRLLKQHPEVLATRTDAVIAGLERAATYQDSYKTRSAGLVLGGIVQELAPDTFAAVAPRLLALYKARAPAKKTEKKLHWIWENKELRHRLAEVLPEESSLLLLNDDCSSGCQR